MSQLQQHTLKFTTLWYKLPFIPQHKMNLLIASLSETCTTVTEYNKPHWGEVAIKIMMNWNWHIKIWHIQIHLFIVLSSHLWNSSNLFSMLAKNNFGHFSMQRLDISSRIKWQVSRYRNIHTVIGKYLFFIVPTYSLWQQAVYICRNCYPPSHQKADCIYTSSLILCHVNQRWLLTTVVFDIIQYSIVFTEIDNTRQPGSLIWEIW